MRLFRRPADERVPKPTQDRLLAPPLRRCSAKVPNPAVLAALFGAGLRPRRARDRRSPPPVPQLTTNNEQLTNFPIFSVAFSMKMLSSPDPRSIPAPTQIRIICYAQSPFPPDWVRSSIFHGFRRSFALSPRHVAQVFSTQSPILPPALDVPQRHPRTHPAPRFHPSVPISGIRG